jgi:hypothetical protein
MKTTILLLLFSASLLSAQDVLFLKNGEKRPGRVMGLEALKFRLEVPLPASPGSAPSASPVFASVSVPRADVDYIEFAPDPALEALLKSATPAQIAEIEARWSKAEPWLSIPRSSAARIAISLGGLLLQTGDTAQASRALELFKKVEAGAWSPVDTDSAKQGRLRAMVAMGNAKDAVAEAAELVNASEDPTVLIEAKYILASATDASLRQLLKDNPRWEEDLNVIPERHRLYNELEFLNLGGLEWRLLLKGDLNRLDGVAEFLHVHVAHGVTVADVPDRLGGFL